jgi:hypothetical protein
MPQRAPLDWEDLERELHAAGVSAEEIETGARQLLAQARGHQLAETSKQLGLGQKQIADAMGVSAARRSRDRTAAASVSTSISATCNTVSSDQLPSTPALKHRQ